MDLTANANEGQPIADCFCEVCQETTRHYVRDLGPYKALQCSECLTESATLEVRKGYAVLQ